jgi:hypothetical protein
MGFSLEGAPLTQLTRSEEIRARALMLNRLDGTYKRSIALVELRHDEMLLPLRPVAGHTTQYSRIGTYSTASQHLKHFSTAYTQEDDSRNRHSGKNVISRGQIYIVVDRSKITQGIGIADHTIGIVKWGGVDVLSSASALR